jgi:hypothetical protein
MNAVARIRDGDRTQWSLNLDLDEPPARKPLDERLLGPVELAGRLSNPAFVAALRR